MSNDNYISSYSGSQVDGVLGLFHGKGLDQVTGLVQRNADGTFSVGSGGGGTVTSVATGAGLTGGPVTSSGTIKANLVSETSQGTIGVTDKLYAVGVDSTGALCASIPWTNTTYTAGTGISIDSNNVISVDLPNAEGGEF